ncbi:hypothetical protein [Flavobacterium sp.]|uniref:phosphoribosyltransferase-like protein n=1 Tax=Flavobacterium sp. TaxID=239 RepID=UPI0032664064
MDAILTPEPLEDENLIFQDIRGLLTRLHQLVKGDASMPSVTGIYGYRGTGSLAILYNNCPNNVPPVVHSRSDTWKPLFPRSSRI